MTRRELLNAAVHVGCAFLFLVLSVCLASAAHASKTFPEDVVEAGRAVAAMSGLRDAGCPLDGSASIPSYFHRERSGASYIAETALVLPMTLEQTVRILRSVEEYPRWAFVDSNGAPNLKGLTFDRHTGRGEVRIADNDEATLQGRFTLHRDGEGFGVRLELLESDPIKNVVLEVVAFPAEACPDATLVTLRLGWKIGFFGRIVARDLAWIPGLFVVALRDDLVAQALVSERAVSVLLPDLAERDDDGWRYVGEISLPPGIDPETIEEWRIRRIEPDGIRMPASRLARLAPLASRMERGKPSSAAVSFGAFFGGLEGRHTICAYRVTLNAATWRRIGDPANMLYSVFLSVTDEGGSLGMSVDFP